MSDSHQIISEAMTGHRTLRAPSPRAQIAPPPRLLVDAGEGAELLNVSLRTFHKLRRQLPSPVALGGRCVRWRVAELAAWANDLPAAAVTPEPQQLAAVRARKKHAAAPSAGGANGGTQPPIAQSEQGRGALQNSAPSNPKTTIEVAL